MPDLLAPYDPTVLPSGVRSRFVDNGNGLTMHVLEAGHEGAGRPCVLLLHGFPELAYSWRRVMPALAAAGYHVIAPDQRGYGRTTGGDADYAGDWRSFRFLNLVRDAMGLLAALERLADVHAVVGHDFGSWVAAWCALLRPDVFPRVVLMSAPFGGAPALPVRDVGGAPALPVRDVGGAPALAVRDAGGAPALPNRDVGGAPALPVRDVGDVHAALAALPRPRKHYQRYYTTPEADGDMWRCAQGVHDFLRAYYHHKSADWAGNRPHRLASGSAVELAKMPTYYVMDLHETMAQTVAHEMPGAEAIAGCRWLPEHELRMYSAEYGRTGFQGGLQWYRCAADAQCVRELQLFSGRTIDVPSMYIAGASDWGIYQNPGAFEAMQTRACTRMRAAHLVEGAGHWVQQEQPKAVNRLLLEFMS